jgi:hypothetical protein
MVHGHILPKSHEARNYGVSQRQIIRPVWTGFFSETTVLLSPVGARKSTEERTSVISLEVAATDYKLAFNVP